MAYGESYAYGNIGPEAFVVEDESVFILDTSNQRVVIWKDGQFSDFDISACPSAQHMTYEDGKIGVIDTVSNVTGIYSLDGTKNIVITHPEEFDYHFPVEISEIGDSYVVWKTTEGMEFKYYWGSELLESVESRIIQVKLGETVTRITENNTTAEWKIDSKNKLIEVFEANGENLIYSQYELVTGIDFFWGELSVRKIDEKGEEEFSIIDTSAWHTNPTHPLYMSSDGKIYVMDCLENIITISEVVLGTTDISKMSNLYAQTELRRTELANLKAKRQVELTSSTGSLVSVTRNQAVTRASNMTVLRWIVRDEHKDPTNGINIPNSVLNTADDTYYTGIPYCWGGANGCDDLPMGESFASLISENGMYPGNTNTNTVYETSIGVDCSGFVACAYKMQNGSKIGTGYFATYGHEISTEELAKGDYLVKVTEQNDNHIVLFGGYSGQSAIIYQAEVSGQGNNGVYPDGRTKRSLVNLNNVYGLSIPFK